jgi:1-acyl-sn-glycerol-3-phosphate acyltransferase
MTTCGRLHDNRPEETRVPRQAKRRTISAEKSSPWLRFIVVVLYLPLSALFKLRWRGVENVPAAGPAILVINHVSYADPLVVARYVYDAGRAPRFLAKRSLFDLPVVGAAFRGTGQIPVDRGTSAARQSLEGAVAALFEATCQCPPSVYLDADTKVVKVSIYSEASGRQLSRLVENLERVEGERHGRRNLARQQVQIALCAPGARP